MFSAFLTAALLLEVWNKRTKKTRISLFDIRSTLEAKVSLLRETTNNSMYETLRELIAAM